MWQHWCIEMYTLLFTHLIWPHHWRVRRLWMGGRLWCWRLPIQGTMIIWWCVSASSVQFYVNKIFRFIMCFWSIQRYIYIPQQKETLFGFVSCITCGLNRNNTSSVRKCWWNFIPTCKCAGNKCVWKSP